MSASDTSMNVPKKVKAVVIIVYVMKIGSLTKMRGRNETFCDMV